MWWNHPLNFKSIGKIIPYFVSGSEEEFIPKNIVKPFLLIGVFLAFIGEVRATNSGVKPAEGATEKAEKKVPGQETIAFKKLEGSKSAKAPRFFEKNRDLLNLSFSDAQGDTTRVQTWLVRHKKPVLLVFWATWCGPCMQEMPSLAKMQSDLKDHIDVLAISLDNITDEQGLRKSLKSFSLPLYESTELAKVMEKRGLRGVPSFILLSPEGRDLLTSSGAKDWGNKVTQGWLLSHLPKGVPSTQKKIKAPTSNKGALDGTQNSSLSGNLEKKFSKEKFHGGDCTKDGCDPKSVRKNV